MTGWPFSPPPRPRELRGPHVVYDCPQPPFGDENAMREIASLRAENARLQRIADAQPGFDNVIIAQLRAENAALKAKLARMSAPVTEAEWSACGFHAVESARMVAIYAIIDRRLKDDAILGTAEDVARIEADMAYRLDDPVVRASVCRLPKGYHAITGGKDD